MGKVDWKKLQRLVIGGKGLPLWTLVILTVHYCIRYQNVLVPSKTYPNGSVVFLSRKKEITSEWQIYNFTIYNYWWNIFFNLILSGVWSHPLWLFFENGSWTIMTMEFDSISLTFISFDSLDVLSKKICVSVYLNIIKSWVFCRAHTDKCRFTLMSNVILGYTRVT